MAIFLTVYLYGAKKAEKIYSDFDAELPGFTLVIFHIREFLYRYLIWLLRGYVAVLVGIGACYAHGFRSQARIASLNMIICFTAASIYGLIAALLPLVALFSKLGN